jgi:hypothetical protein
MGLETIVQMLNPAASGSNPAVFPSLRRALEGLGAALRKGAQANDAQALHDVEATASAEVWDGLWASGQSLPFWSRPSYARYRDEIQSLLRDLRNPVEGVSAAKCARQLERITPLLNGLDQWEERSRRSESWWRGIKSVALLGAGVFGTAVYFLTRAVGNLEVDAVTMLCPAPAPSDLANDSEERSRFLRDYSAFFFGQPNTAIPLFQQGITKPPVVAFSGGQGSSPELTETERRLQSVLTPTQNVYDWLAQGDPEGRFVFSARLVNRSSRGARFVKTLTTRLTLLETIDIPWNDLPVKPNLDCRLDLQSRMVVIHNQLGPPALKVRWKLMNGETELAAGDNSPVLLADGIERVSLSWMRQLSLMEFKRGTQHRQEERIVPSDRRNLRLSEHPPVADEAVASSDCEAERRDLRYWATTDASPATPGRIYFETPRTRQELEESCDLTHKVKLIIECEDLRGQKHSKDFQLLLPENWTFAIPKQFSAERGWEIPQAQVHVYGPTAAAPVSAYAPAAVQFLAAARDTADHPSNRHEEAILVSIIDWSGESLVRGDSVKHRCEFNTYLSPEGVVLLTGAIRKAPSGRYRIEIIADDAPIGNQEFVAYPMVRFLKPFVGPSVTDPLSPPQSLAGKFRESVDRFRKHCGLAPTDVYIDDSISFGGVYDHERSSVPDSRPSRYRNHLGPRPDCPAPASPAPAIEVAPAPAAE